MRRSAVSTRRAAVGGRARGSIAVVSCEHGGNRIPAPYRALFLDHEAVLGSHRGFDPGALELARELAGACETPLIASTTSRLLVELNRSPHHPKLFSEFTRSLSPPLKDRILQGYYVPYRARVESAVRSGLGSNRRVVHLSAHSFTPVLDGEVRAVDVGLLYDPRRGAERRFCERWSALLAERIAPLRVRRNSPYRGTADGLTTALRRRFPATRYLGIEIEVNQKHVLPGGRAWRTLRAEIVRSALLMLREEAGR